MQSKIDTETDKEFTSNCVNPLVKPAPISPYQSGNLFPKEIFWKFDRNSLSISVSVSDKNLIKLQSEIDTETDREFTSNCVNPLVKPPPISPYQSGNLFPKEIFWMFDRNSLSISVSVSDENLIRMQSKIDTETVR